MNSIEKPKVFISYAWTSQEYSERVTIFVNKLLGHGIDVLFDKYENIPGKDLFCFMEKSINDTSVTNVLLLLNPTYKEKADQRIGGVGYEGTIISSEIFNKTEQTKFIPVIFDKEDKSINECLPTFLRTRVYHDLSEDSEIEYKKLVKILYGRPEDIKPEIGVPPLWLDQPINIIASNPMVKSVYQVLSKLPISDPLIVIGNELEKLADSIFTIEFEKIQSENIVQEFEKLVPFRDVYIAIINQAAKLLAIEKHIWYFFSYILKQKKSKENLINERIYDYFCTELFIYTIAILYKKKNFSAIGYLVSVEWIEMNVSNVLVHFDGVFYHYDFDSVFKNYYFARDNEAYLSGTAMFWMEHMSVILTREEFANADILLSNLAIIVNDTQWFSKSYIFANVFHNTMLSEISMALKSAKLKNEYLLLFDCSNIEELKEKMKRMYSFKSSNSFFGYSNSWHPIPLLDITFK